MRVPSNASFDERAWRRTSSKAGGAEQDGCCSLAHKSTSGKIGIARGYRPPIQLPIGDLYQHPLLPAPGIFPSSAPVTGVDLRARKRGQRIGTERFFPLLRKALL